MREKPFSPALVKDLMDEIRAQIGESAKAGPLGKLEGKLSLWKSQDDNLLNTLQISYRNALGDPVRHSFGSFRLNGSLELSCFAGLRVVSKLASKLAKARLGPSGALALLGTPSIDASKAGGRAGVKAEGFGGRGRRRTQRCGLRG